MNGTITDPEIIEEIAALDLVTREKQIVDGAAARAKALRLASIAQTVAQDWILHQGQDGSTYGYLQDSGCQRVANLWGIQFERVRLSDFVREELDEGNVRFEIMVTGRSIRTDLERTEIGSRTTGGFFEKAWQKACANDDEGAKAVVLANVKKAALTNAHGRVVRALTGLGRMPVEELQAVLGEKAQRAGRVEYQRGTSGGAAQKDAATDGQLKRIAVLACMEEIVQGCEKKDYADVLKGLQRACRPPLTKKRASDIMEWLETRSREDDRPTKDEFRAEVGWPEKTGNGTQKKQEETQNDAS